MNTFQLIQQGVIWGIVFGALFSGAILIIGRINPVMLLNDYPPDIRARYGAMNAETRRQAKLASLPLLAVLGLVLLLALAQLRAGSGELTLANTWLVTTIILQMWNLIDLIVLDWFILLTLQPRFMILPGTAGMAGYRDYAYHLRKFGNGIGLTLVLSSVITAIALLVERVL